jgi:hypothetical protein
MDLKGDCVGFSSALTMMYNTQNLLWVSGLFTSYAVLSNYKTAFREMDLFPSSGEGDIYSVVSLTKILQLDKQSDTRLNREEVTEK